MARDPKLAFAAIVSIALVAATLEPLVRDPFDDGFPLSTYPMFARDRGHVLAMPYPVGITRSGERRYLTPKLIGSGEVLQALRIVERALGDARTLDALCREIAARVRADDDYTEVVTLRILRGKHDAVKFFTERELGPEQERASCAVR